MTPLDAATVALPSMICPRCRRDGRSAALPDSGPCAGCGLAAGRTAGGARVVLADPALPAAPYYEAERTRNEYLAFHYPSDADPLRALLGAATPPLATRYPWAVQALWQPPAVAGPALDIGCACGTLTFALARDHGAAWGLDRSEVLIDAACAVRAARRARYRVPIEGDIAEEHDVAVEVPPPPGADFLVGDALALPFPDATFATALALNLIDRVPDPARALAEALRVTAPGGALIVGSPYTWLPEYAPRERWLGGVVRDGRAVLGAAGVQAALGAGAKLERAEDRLMYIPHHARSGQLGRVHLQRFRRIPTL